MISSIWGQLVGHSYELLVLDPGRFSLLFTLETVGGHLLATHEGFLLHTLPTWLHLIRLL